MSNFKMEEFIDYLNIRFSDLFKTNCYAANKLFDNFVSKFAQVVYSFAPKRNATRKEKSSNPGLHVANLNLFKPKTNCLNACMNSATIKV